MHDWNDLSGDATQCAVAQSVPAAAHCPLVVDGNPLSTECNGSAIYIFMLNGGVDSTAHTYDILVAIRKVHAV
jgi:hypothetical protein